MSRETASERGGTTFLFGEVCAGRDGGVVVVMVVVEVYVRPCGPLWWEETFYFNSPKEMKERAVQKFTGMCLTGEN